MEDAHTTTLYEAIGGEAAVCRLTQRFCAIMDTACRTVHPSDLSGSKAKLFDDLTGWLGGPAEIEGWRSCFTLALEETGPQPKLRGIIRGIVIEPVTRLAHHMHNGEGA